MSVSYGYLKMFGYIYLACESIVVNLFFHEMVFL